MNNAEAIVIKWIEDTFGDGIPVFGNKPKDTPNDRYILVDRTGGGRGAMVLDRAEILIEVYDKNSRFNASEMASKIGDRIRELTAYNDNLTHADVNSMINLDDLNGQYFRYQLYCDVWVRR